MGLGASFLIVLSLAPAEASSANISRSYQSDSSISSGGIVSLERDRSDYVQLANTTNGSRLLGVAVGAKDSLLAVDVRTGKLQVATSGSVNTLVSTLNGDIRVGDQVGVSPLNGVGMKALLGSRVIGLSQSEFNRNSDGATPQIIKDKNGKTSQVYVGYVRINIAVGTNNGANGGELTSLQRVVQSITGRTVSNIKIILSLVVILLSLMALITLTYASIYSSIISIGRNPLAKHAIFRTLGSVLFMAGLTTLVASVTVFLLLR